MKRCLVVCLLFVVAIAKAQDVKQRLDQQVRSFIADTQMRAGILGFYVADAKTGEEVYSWNAKAGLAPASTQKIVTSVAAFDILGKDYRYKTEFGYYGKQNGETVDGNLIVKGYGDPTLGSWRYKNTKADVVSGNLLSLLKQKKIKRFTGSVVVNSAMTSYQPTPGGWIWDDIGNYYGAGTWGLNWRENQFDLLLKPGAKEGDKVEILGTEPKLEIWTLVNQLKTGKKGSGDNGYIYLPPYSSTGFVEGTVPAGESSFKISGAIPDAPYAFGTDFQKMLSKQGITVDGKVVTSGMQIANNSTVANADQLLYIHYSPAMDSVVYWFMRKSINLYGEALIKTIAFEKTGVGSTDSGVAYVRRHFRDKGFDPATLKIMDGSGLSPSNRITAEALGKMLLYAKKQNWFSSFAESFPTYNNMNVKSGTIRGVKGYAGYHTSTSGKEYVVVIIVNNYDGTAGSIERKMFKVLDVLK